MSRTRHRLNRIRRPTSPAGTSTLGQYTSLRALSALPPRPSPLLYHLPRLRRTCCSLPYTPLQVLAQLGGLAALPLATRSNHCCMLVSRLPLAALSRARPVVTMAPSFVFKVVERVRGSNPTARPRGRLDASKAHFFSHDYADAESALWIWALELGLTRPWAAARCPVRRVNFDAVCACYGPGASVTEQKKASRTCLQPERTSCCKESNDLHSKPEDL